MAWRGDYSSTSYLNNINDEEDEDGATSGASGVKYVQMMTDEQIEMLRRQISAYIVISERLAEMNMKSNMAGMSLGSPYTDMLLSGVYMISARHRWIPTVAQLEILERIFEQVHGAPNKRMIEQITYELSQYGPITDTNVYNWFQNRKARSKRKQTAASSNTESKYEADVETSVNKRIKSDNTHSKDDQPPSREENSSLNQEVVPELHAKDQETRNRYQTRDGRGGLSWGT